MTKTKNSSNGIFQQAENIIDSLSARETLAANEIIRFDADDMPTARAMAAALVYANNPTLHGNGGDTGEMLIERQGFSYDVAHHNARIKFNAAPFKNTQIDEVVKQMKQNLRQLQQQYALHQMGIHSSPGAEASITYAIEGEALGHPDYAPSVTDCLMDIIDSYHKIGKVPTADELLGAPEKPPIPTLRLIRTPHLPKPPKPRLQAEAPASPPYPVQPQNGHVARLQKPPVKKKVSSSPANGKAKQESNGRHEKASHSNSNRIPATITHLEKGLQRLAAVEPDSEGYLTAMLLVHAAKTLAQSLDMRKDLHCKLAEALLSPETLHTAAQAAKLGETFGGDRFAHYAHGKLMTTSRQQQDRETVKSEQRKFLASDIDAQYFLLERSKTIPGLILLLQGATLDAEGCRKAQPDYMKMQEWGVDDFKVFSDTLEDTCGRFLVSLGQNQTARPYR